MGRDREGGRERKVLYGREWGTSAPEETDETVFKVTGNGYDGIKGVAPDDEDTFVTL